jgi:hypothetical protein
VLQRIETPEQCIALHCDTSVLSYTIRRRRRFCHFLYRLLPKGFVSVSVE